MESGGANGAAPPAPAAAAVIREQDRLMPIANVIRIMRRVLPPHAKIADDAKEVIQECVSEFISFVTGEANERCHGERRKTVTAEDIVWAMDRLGFDDYVLPLTVYLQRMREGESDDGEGRRRGHRAIPRPPAPRAAAPRVSALHGVQVQMPMQQQQPLYAAAPAPPSAHAMYAAPPPAHAMYAAPPPEHAVGMPMMPDNGPLVQYEPYGAASGGCADEASSSASATPAPTVGGAGSQ